MSVVPNGTTDADSLPLFRCLDDPDCWAQNDEFFQARGFKVVHLYSPEELEKLYLIRQDGSSVGQICGAYYAIHLEVL